MFSDLKTSTCNDISHMETNYDQLKDGMGELHEMKK